MELEQVAKLVNAHNRSRIERLWALAPPKQQSFFELLPLIFHSNDQALPAHVANAPVGIRGYHPTEQFIANIKKSYPGFTHTHQAFINYPLEGLYLINQNGELHYPKQAQFDLWLVYKSSNSEQNVELLKQKLQEVLVWAKSLGISLNGRLLNETAVAEHSIASDELDIFYSSSLVLAGATPLWWYIRPEQTESYTVSAETVAAQLPNDIFTLDFGPLTERNPEQVLSNAVNANLTAMQANLPSYLEPIFQRVLVEKDLNTVWLADEHKRLVFDNQKNSFLFDPNLLKLNVISKHLSYDLQQWAQRSLYLMCHERLSIPVTLPKFPWRRENLSDLVKQWQWHHSEIIKLDKRPSAATRERLDEFAFTKKLSAELNSIIARFSQRHPEADANKLTLLQKTFEDIFDTAPGVIPRLPDSLIPDTAEPQLFLEYSSPRNEWLINDVDLTNKTDEASKPLYASSSIIHTLAWAISNGALSKYTQVKLTANSGVITTEGIHNLISYIHKSPLGSSETATTDLTWIMFANMQDTPKEAYKQQDVKLSLYQRDPLNYGYHRRNMVLDIEVLAYQKGQKWHYFKFDGTEASNQALASLVRWQIQPSQSNYIDSWCPTINFSGSIINRLNELADKITQHYARSPENGKYIFEVADRNATIHWQSGIVEDSLAGQSQTISEALAQPTSAYTDVQLDQQLDRDGLFSLLLKSHRHNQVQVFLYTTKSHVDLYIVDELGHLFKQTFEGLRESTLVNNFNSFLSEVSERNGLEQLKFYKLQKEDVMWTTLPVNVDNSEASKAYLPVKVKMREPSASTDCNISCGNQQFRGKANDPALFHQVYELVTKLRKSNINYPLYISSISFVGDKPFGTYHYITFKQRLERILNLK